MVLRCLESLPGLVAKSCQRGARPSGAHPEIRVLGDQIASRGQDFRNPKKSASNVLTHLLS